LAFLVHTSSVVPEAPGSVKGQTLQDSLRTVGEAGKVACLVRRLGIDCRTLWLHFFEDLRMKTSKLVAATLSAAFLAACGGSTLPAKVVQSSLVPAVQTVSSRARSSKCCVRRSERLVSRSSPARPASVGPECKPSSIKGRGCNRPRSPRSKRSLNAASREVVPKLDGYSLSQIAKATGLLLAARSRIRAGTRVPHPRHWEGNL